LAGFAQRVLADVGLKCVHAYAVVSCISSG
jgi:hypothetical protein